MQVAAKLWRELFLDISKLRMEGFFNSLLDGSDNTFTAELRAMRSVPINTKNTIFLCTLLKLMHTRLTIKYFEGNLLVPKIGNI